MLIVNITLNIWKIKLLLNRIAVITELNILLCAVFFNYGPYVPEYFLKRHITLKFESCIYSCKAIFLFELTIKRNLNILNNAPIFKNKTVKLGVLVVRNIERKFKAIAISFKRSKLTRRINCFKCIILFAKIKGELSFIIIKRTCRKFISSRR